MAQLIFSVVWTLGATVVAIALFRQAGGEGVGALGLALLLMFPAAGGFFMWESWRRLRRRRSLRRTRDPRDDWDASDGDGDGGGD